MHYIVLNGPPGVGKTTVATAMRDHLRASGRSVWRASFAAPLKAFVMGATGMDYADLAPAFKDGPLQALNGESWRRFMIEMSESYIKPKYGRDFFAIMFRNRCELLGYDIVIVDDIGFPEELEQLQPNVTLIHILRDGHSFEKDSRAYLPAPHLLLVNNDSLERLKAKACALVELIALRVTHTTGREK